MIGSVTRWSVVPRKIPYNDLLNTVKSKDNILRKNGMIFTAYQFEAYVSEVFLL